jgi:hypothetical protein
MKHLSQEGENEKPSQLPVYVMKEWMEWKRRE